MLSDSPDTLFMMMVPTSNFQGSWYKVSCNKLNGLFGGIHLGAAFSLTLVSVSVLILKYGLLLFFSSVLLDEFSTDVLAFFGGGIPVIKKN